MFELFVLKHKQLCYMNIFSLEQKKSRFAMVFSSKSASNQFILKKMDEVNKLFFVLLFPSFGGMLICFGFLPVMILLNSLKVVPVTCTVAHGKVCKYCCRYCRKEKHFYNHS